MVCTSDVSGLRSVGGQRRKGSEWWNEDVGRAVAEKRRAFEEWLQRRYMVACYRYRAQTGRETGSKSCEKNGDGESDLEMISRVIKRCFRKR